MGRRRSMSKSRSQSRSGSINRSRSRSRSPRRRVKRERRSSSCSDRDNIYERKEVEDVPKNIQMFEAFVEKNSSVKDTMQKFGWNYEDANMWVEIIKELEILDATVEVMRAAFTEILDRWPYCYGYWCKWATIEAKTDTKKAFEVFDYAVNTFPLSVELWLAYIRFMRTELMKRKDGLEGIQRLNARALVTVGKEWRSLPVWKEVIAFETSIGNPLAVTVVMDNMMGTPLGGLDEAWELVSSHFETTSLDNLMSLNERTELKWECLSERMIDEERNEEMAIRLRGLARRRVIYEETKKKMRTMELFESKVKRHYFHWKPLERGQLINWKKYIEWTRKNSSEGDDCVLIFERALIPCALYDEFWLMYAEYRESRGELELAREILERAHRIHCKQSVNITVHLASLLEIMDRDLDATEALISFDSKYPGNLLIYNRYIAMLKRRELKYPGKESKRDKSVSETYECLIRFAVLPYSHYCLRVREREVDTKDRHSISSYYSLHYARYLRKIKGQSKMAMKVIKTAINNDPSNETLYHALIDLHYEKYPLDIESMKDSFDLCLNSPLTPHRVKIRMSQCKIELFEEIGDCPKEMRELNAYHRELMATNRGEKEKEKDISQ